MNAAEAPQRYGGDSKWRPIFDLYAGVVNPAMEESLPDLEWSLPPPPRSRQDRHAPRPPQATFDGVMHDAGRTPRL
jgi:hypothetical protein